MILSINQPAYLPWLGYFHRIAVSDLHVVLDTVQFEKNSFVNRNRVRTREGSCWLTVPLHTKGRFGQLAIDSLETVDDGWRRKHWDTLRQSYARAPAFASEADFFAGIYARKWPLLLPLVEEMNAHLRARLGIATRIVRASEIGAAGAKDELVLNLCRAVGATTYLSGPLGRDYLEPARFAEAGIRLAFHDYHHPIYAQAHPGFEPAMAAVDLVFNHGQESLRILSQGNVSPGEL